MRTITAVVAVSLALAGCAGEPGEQPAGIRGRVLAGPTCPVETEESPCPPRPAEALVRATRVGDDGVSAVRTDSSGRFLLPLPPGRYLVTVEAGYRSTLVSPEPVDVTVPSRGFVEVNLLLDTGIRQPSRSPGP